jgi:DNA ligase-1
MLREPLDIMVCIAFLVMAATIAGLLLELPDGRRFALGTGLRDVERANPPALGSQISYTYRGRTPQGLPRFASFLRVRAAE